MTTWDAVLVAAPELAGLVEARFEATGLGLLATIRRDGSPRISGIEPFFLDGELWLGSMWDARKAQDLHRDPRLALHAATVDRELKDGDARIAGRAEEIVDDAVKARVAAAIHEVNGFDPDVHGPWHLFRVDVTEVVFVEAGADALVIRSWRPGTEPKRVERR